MIQKDPQWKLDSECDFVWRWAYIMHQILLAAKIAMLPRPLVSFSSTGNRS